MNSRQFIIQRNLAKQNKAHEIHVELVITKINFKENFNDKWY